MKQLFNGTSTRMGVSLKPDFQKQKLLIEETVEFTPNGVFKHS